MSIQMLVEEELERKLRNDEMAVCSVIVSAYPDPHIPVRAAHYLKNSIELLIKKRHELGVLEPGYVWEIEECRHVDNLIAVVIPDPREPETHTFETLKKCYINALEYAYNTGSERFVLPPFYAGGLHYDADTVYAALFDAADSFLTKYGNESEIYVSVRSKANYSEMSRAFNDELKYGRRAFAEKNPGISAQRLAYMRENANPAEKALRLAAKWNRTEVNKFKKKHEDFISENPHLGGSVYRHDILVQYITDKVGDGKEYSQNAFAAKCDLNVSVINRIITGARKEIKKETALKIAVGLKLKEKDFRKFILCSGSSFPCCEEDNIILKYVRAGNYDYISIEEEIESLRKSKEKEKNENLTQ